MTDNSSDEEYFDSMPGTKTEQVQDLETEVFSFSSSVNKHWQSDMYDTFDCEIKVVLFMAEDIPSQDCLAKLDVEIVGPYFVYKQK